MDFSEFLGLVVRIDLVSSDKYFYHGKVLEVDDKFIKLIDEKERNVCVRIDEIKNIRGDN